MKTGITLRGAEMMLISLGLASFTLGYTLFYLVVAAYCFLKIRTRKYPLDLTLLFMLVLLSGTIFTLINLLTFKYDSIYTTSILYRTRFFWIRLFFAIGISVYVFALSYKEILRFVYYLSIPNTIAGLIQLFVLQTDRVSLLTPEASMASMYYIFTFPLLLEYYRLHRKSKFWIALFVLVGFFIFSKAQIIVLPLMLLYFVFKSKNSRLKKVVGAIIFIGIIASPLILQIDQFQKINHFLTVLNEKGISGLTEKNQIWTSFTLRFSSFLTAVEVFLHNPFGSGFGSFHPEYIASMTSNSVQAQIKGTEISMVLDNDLYATPKSIFFEYLVSCGLFFLGPILLIVRKCHTTNASVLVKASIYGTVLISLMIESAPFLVFLAIGTALMSKANDPS
ncbi:MAG: O-antigen ligase family protein [Allomuricauda sp.]